MSARILLSLVAAAVYANALAAETPSGITSEERIERMERALQQLQQRNSELEEKVKRLEAREGAQRAEKAEAVVSSRQSTPAPSAPMVPDRSKGPVLPPREPVFELRLSGFVQTQVEAGDASAFLGRFPDSPANVFNAGEVKDRFLIRRARLSLNGSISDNLEFRVEGELFAGADTANLRTDVAARDVFVNWRALPELNVKLGQFKAPYGLEQLTSDSRLISIEPSLVTFALALERQIGLQFSGQPLARTWPERADFLTYYAGIFNGSGPNTAANDNSEFMYAGRLEVVALKTQLLDQTASLRFGANGFYARDESNIISDALLVNEDGSLSPFNFFPAGTRAALGFDVALRLGAFELIAEYLNQRFAPREVAEFVPRTAELRADGYYVQGSYFVVPEKLQLFAKWETFDPDQFAEDDVHSFTAGVNYRIRGDQIKLLANYIHTWADYRAANPRFGREEFNQVTVRLQVMF